MEDFYKKYLKYKEEYFSYIDDKILQIKINNNDIINYINNNRDKIIYICKEQFIKERDFDYIFYSNYYGLLIKNIIKISFFYKLLFTNINNFISIII